MRKFLAAAAVLLASCASEPPPAPNQSNTSSDLEALAADGRDIAEAQCARCHAVGPYGESPDPRAPVFRTILLRYNASVLEQELIEGIRVTHPMPEFQFNPQGTDALIQYLHTIQDPPPAG
jgi:mono/diheme cytochrome c family protein